MNQFDYAEVLLIEDTKSDAELIRRALLRTHPHLKIHLIQDSKEALDFIERKGRYSEINRFNQPKVIFLDLKIPKISGFEVLQKIKNQNSSKLIPVVVISSSGETEDIQACYHNGANSYIVKPMAYLEFETTISNLGTYWLEHNFSLT